MPKPAAADPIRFELPGKDRDGFFRATPFAEQVAFFRGKLGNLVPTAKWDDIKKSAHDRAFMVAGAAKADLLADLASAVDKAIHDGETLEAFRKRFAEIVDKRGWHGWTGDDRTTDRPKGGKGVAWRTRIIYQTNLSTSYAAGRLAQLKDAGFQYWIYRHSGSEHPRLQHLAWDGLTLPADHPFWQTHYPPSAWGCRCRVVGANGPQGARLLGGKPEYNEPPAGWDSIDPKTGEPPGIDKGWGYMPGARSEALRSFVPSWRDEGLPGACHACVRDGHAPKPPMLPPRQAQAGRLLPSGEAPEWYVQRFLAEFGVAPGDIELFRDVAGEYLAIGEALFRDRHGEYKALKRGRERHVLLLADTIRSPDEIWMALETPDKGKKRLRRRYLARWLVEGMEVPALTVFEWSRDLWTGVTAFTPEEAYYLENRARLGTLVWRRKP